MFFFNKRNREIEEIKKQRELLEKEKLELLKIKDQLENTNNPDMIDVSNVYIWEVNGVKNIVELKERSIVGRTMNGLGREASGYESKLIDVFTGKVIYEKSSVSKIERSELLGMRFGEETIRAEFYPIVEEDRTVLEYPNKKVPRYIMYQVFYRINNVDIVNSKNELIEEPKIKFLEK